MQSRLGSAAEAGVNIGIGFICNSVANYFILPLFGFTSLTFAKNMGIGASLTVVSVLRQYILRRWFNGMVKFNKEA